jgi:hypothetical protein
MRFMESEEVPVAGFAGTLRNFVFTPAFDEVTFAKRGFSPGSPDIAKHLEAVPHSVILGFEFGIAAREQDEIVERLELVEAEHRGFAYEGATMALTIRDVMRPGPRRAQKLLLGPASPHIFLAFIGVGFAMARLPRPLWSKVVPDLSGAPYFPAMTWLAVDGYGFDRAYFDTKRWVDQQYLPKPYPWQGEPEYFLRVLDHGIGRALWFMNSADPIRAAAAVERFAPGRRADLWSGVGLAAAFAGGTDENGMEKVRDLSGTSLPDVAQGVAFAARAKVMAGMSSPHTVTAARVICGLSVDEAADIADGAALKASSDGGIEYEAWRVRTREHFLR